MVHICLFPSANTTINGLNYFISNELTEYNSCAVVQYLFDGRSIFLISFFANYLSVNLALKGVFHGMGDVGSWYILEVNLPLILFNKLFCIIFFWFFLSFYLIYIGIRFFVHLDFICVHIVV